jgi:nucleoside-diphosphate-sugar epimerase
MKLLITGVSGFIGRSLVKYIVDNELPIDIYGIDIKIPEFEDFTYRNRVKFSYLDIRNSVCLNDYFTKFKFDGVIHLAAVSRVAEAENRKEDCVGINLRGTKYIVDNLKNTKTWLIYASSREVYGEPEVLPVKETDSKIPVNIYGKCKLESENYIKDNLNRYVIFRFSNVYGNNFDLKDRVIPLFLRKAMNDEPLVIEGGEQVIDFTYIDDTVKSILKAAELLHIGAIDNDTIHLSPGRGNTLKTLITHIELLLDKNTNTIIKEKRDYDVVKFIGDPQHRIEVLGDMKFKSLYEGLEIYVENLKASSN